MLSEKRITSPFHTNAEILFNSDSGETSQMHKNEVAYEQVEFCFGCKIHFVLLFLDKNGPMRTLHKNGF